MGLLWIGKCWSVACMGGAHTGGLLNQTPASRSFFICPESLPSTHTLLLRMKKKKKNILSPQRSQQCTDKVIYSNFFPKSSPLCEPVSTTQKVLQPQQLKSWKLYSSSPSPSHQVPKSKLLIHMRKLGLLTVWLWARDASVLGEKQNNQNHKTQRTTPSPCTRS